MIKKISVLVIILFLIFSAIGGFLVSQKLRQIYARHKTRITVDAYASEYAALVYIAKNKGYFAKNGLDVKINDYEAGRLALEAFLAGGADMVTCADAAFVPKSFVHFDLKILAAIATFRTHRVIALKSHGIVKPQDLKGKKIGVTKESSGEFFLGRVLPSYYLSPQDVEVVDLKPSEIVKALLNGKIDAASAWEPHIYDIKKELADEIITLPSETVQDFTFLLIAKDNWLKDNPKAAKSFLKSLLQAEAFAVENPNEAKQIIQKQFNRDTAFMDYIWPEYDFDVTLTQSLVLLLEDVARWRIDNKLTTKTNIPNYLDFIYMSALEEIKPAAVTIIR